MYYLINYNRKDGKLVEIRDFKDGGDASAAKLRMEIDGLSSSEKNEIVVLEADSLASLMASHSRYFKELGRITIEK
jgi:hypothetical protein